MGLGLKGFRVCKGLVVAELDVIVMGIEKHVGLYPSYLGRPDADQAALERNLLCMVYYS